MEFVDDYHVKMRRIDVGNASGAQALNRSKDVVETLRLPATHPQLAKGRVAQALSKGRETLRKDFLPMRNEQHTRPLQRRTEPHVVDRGHHRLPRAGCGYQEIPVVTE